ncbi:UDP-N-acetylenolpyruvoylglucosamine reductase [Chromatiales bacterium (ex Bugula neritina AB1)]|nr:UDP-N-acetylenolpyruvoylglucosamine reductase [Chromatiales bacterium (ex Bugula neritina AB1)]
MQPESNKSLRHYNSFGFDVRAKYFISVKSVDDLAEVLEWSKLNSLSVYILGGGSNTVFTGDIDGLVIHMGITGSRIYSSDDSKITIEVGAGCDWHQLVIDTLKQKHYGLENLAMIPGLAGAAPIQNIGAYGVEVCERLHSVTTFNRHSGEQQTLTNPDCEFGYRHSLFKTARGRDFIITSITLELSRQDSTRVGYKALLDELEQNGITNPTANDVFNSVCAVRASKLPDPKVLGNAGSFFKNPTLESQQLDDLQALCSDIPVYPQQDGRFKVPAAWLIENAGWKGHRSGPVGVHTKQALVLVNHGGGNGQQIAILADDIQHDIKSRYNIELEREPQII